MSDPVTLETLRRRVENVNRRLKDCSSYVETQRRNGYVGLDEFDTDGSCLRTLTVGTKREVADFLHAMMVGIDLLNRKELT